MSQYDFDDPYEDRALADARVQLGPSERAEELRRFVEVDYGSPMPPRAADYLERQLDSWTSRRAAELAVATRLCAHPNTELSAAGAKMWPCHVDGEIHLETDGARILERPRMRMHWQHKCHQSRICPHEARAAAQEFIADTVPAVQLMRGFAKARIQYWVLSPPNVPFHELADAKRRHYRTVAKLLNKLRARGELLGAFVAQEDPLARDRASWNVHFNVLAVLPGPYAPWRWIRAELGWQCWMTDERAMIRRTLARARRADLELQPASPSGPLTGATILAGAMREVIKYSAKLTASPGKRAAAAAIAEDHPEADGEAPPLTDWSDDALEIWWYANKGFRRVRTYGHLNAQVKLTADDFARWPLLRPYEQLAFDASPAVQGQRIRALREAAGVTRAELARRIAPLLELGEFEALCRLTDLEPADPDQKHRQKPPRTPLTAREAEGVSRALGVAPRLLTTLRGVSVVELARFLISEPEPEGWARAGFVRWHRGDARYRALYLIQAAKSPGENRAWRAASRPRGPPDGRAGPDPPDGDPWAGPELPQYGA